MSYNDLTCQVKGQRKERKDAERLIEAVSRVIGLLDTYEFTKQSGAHWPGCLDVLRSGHDCAEVSARTAGIGAAG